MGTLTSPMVSFSILYSIICYFGGRKGTSFIFYPGSSPYFMPKPFCSRLVFSGLFWSSLILFMPNGVFAQSRDSNAIRCWELIVTTPACNSKGILDSTLVTDGKIYHYGNFIMREDTFPELLRSQGQYRFVSRHRYFVYEKDSIFGFEYKLGIAGHKRKKVTDPGRVSEWELDAGLV